MVTRGEQSDGGEKRNGDKITEEQMGEKMRGEKRDQDERIWKVRRKANKNDREKKR